LFARISLFTCSDFVAPQPALRATFSRGEKGTAKA
jgi:hypothetical protein